jgi:tetratricopeptide (TPR) repeat protein
MTRLRNILAAICVAGLLAGCGGGDATTGENNTGVNAGSPTALGGGDAGDSATSSAAGTSLAKGSSAPLIQSSDIYGADVDLAAIIEEEPGLVIMFFFTVDSGQAIAAKLRSLDTGFGQDLKVVALGIKEEESALKSFADENNIGYHIIEAEALEEADWLDDINALPLTLFVHPNKDREIVQRLAGAGSGNANIITQVAKKFFQHGRQDVAESIANAASESGEDGAGVAETLGFIYLRQGKTDEAQKEFKSFDLRDGLASVEYERGDYEKALYHAAQSESSLASTVEARIHLKNGKVDEAETAAQEAEARPGDDWQKSEAANISGRVKHEKGDVDGAIDKYKEATDLSNYNTTAMSNRAHAHREKGDIQEAQAVLEEAEGWGGAEDEMIVMMTRQVAKELENSNDLERLKLIQGQIKDLGARFRELQTNGDAEPQDTWSTRPQVVAFIESTAGGNPYFERAGMDMVIKREIEARVSADPRIQVVERDMLEALLQELNLGSSEIADKNTQLQFGKVLSARMLGIVEFGRFGKENVMNMRLADTQTTEVHSLPMVGIKDGASLGEIVQSGVDAIIARFVEGRELRGLLGSNPEDDNMIVNLGKAHGIAQGMRFDVVMEGEPVTAGGRVLGHAQVLVALIEVVSVEEEYSICKLVLKKDKSLVLTGDMKVKQNRV